MQENHYVLVIHGTWASDAEPWYEPSDADPENFCYRLNNRLEEIGLGRPVWRKAGQEEINFRWSGLNKHECRLEAGKALFELIKKIVRLDKNCRIHFVAHSHGANVTLVALNHYFRYLENDSRRLIRRVFANLQTREPQDAIEFALKQIGYSEVANRD